MDTFIHSFIRLPQSNVSASGKCPVTDKSNKKKKSFISLNEDTELNLNLCVEEYFLPFVEYH